MSLTPNPLVVSYDEKRDELTIDGKKYSGDFFRFFDAANNGKIFRFKNVDPFGSITIETLDRATLRRVIDFGQ